GRATRRADHIGKEFFRIFDAVDIYANLQALSDMRPVVSDPNVPLATLIADLARAPTDDDRGFVRAQIVVRLRRINRLLTATPPAPRTTSRGSRNTFAKIRTPCRA